MVSFKKLLPAQIHVLKSKKLLLIPLSLVFFLAVALPAFSQSGTYFNNAKLTYDRYCKARSLPTGTTAISCFVFDKVLELQTAFDNLNTKVSNLESENNNRINQISSVENRISQLEASLSALMITPTPDTRPFEASIQVALQGINVINNLKAFSATISANKNIKSCNYSYSTPEICTVNGNMSICTGGGVSGTGSINGSICTFNGETNGNISSTVTSFYQEQKNLNYSF